MTIPETIGVTLGILGFIALLIILACGMYALLTEGDE